MNCIEHKKIVFVSNFLSPHQKPFCDEMNRLCEDNFRFVATKPMNDERKGLGYSDLDSTSYVIKAYESISQLDVAKSLIDEADVVIIGSAPDSLILRRLKAEKITFKYSERILKKELTIRTLPRFVLGTWLHHRRFSKFPLYMLCASAFEAHDLARLGCYKDKMFCWGYFPDLRIYDDVDLLIEKKKKDTILWAGRFIDWKHPEYCILLAESLRNEGYEFEINMIGTGEMQENLREMIVAKDLTEYVHLLGAMPPQMVRNHMEDSAVYLITSNRVEGWGAVLNESMNSACAVVAGSLVGAAPYLVKDGENGLIFRNEDLEDLISKVKKLLDNHNLIRKYGKNAYFTIKNKWNYKTAAGNLLALIENIEKGAEVNPIEGPCQPAPIISDDWYEWKKM
jgi:glycosyltransferase involved in cell wall biosynthesis